MATSCTFQSHAKVALGYVMLVGCAENIPETTPPVQKVQHTLWQEWWQS